MGYHGMRPWFKGSKALTKVVDHWGARHPENVIQGATEDSVINYKLNTCKYPVREPVIWSSTEQYVRMIQTPIEYSLTAMVGWFLPFYYSWEKFFQLNFVKIKYIDILMWS